MRTSKCPAFLRHVLPPSLTMAACLLGSVIAATPVTSHAQGISLVECVGTHSATWTPGLSNTAKTVTVSTKSLWSCPLSGTSATSAQQFQQLLSCDSLLQPTKVTWIIAWADGQTSTAQLTGDVENIDGNLVVPLTGTITAGLYNGDNVAITVTDTDLGSTLENACNSPAGLTNASGPITLTITGL